MIVLKNPKIKKSKIVVLLSLIALIALLIYNPQFIKTMIRQWHKYEWPNTKASLLLPEPESKNGWIEISKEDEILINIYRVSKRDFNTYLGKCYSRSFDRFTKYTEYYYSAYDWKGNYLEILYDYKNRLMQVHMYESEEKKILEGIDHLEFGYSVEYAWTKGEQNMNAEYDVAVLKYLNPIKTTVGELKEDFPLNENSCISAKKGRVHLLKDQEEVWVYATCYENSESVDLKFTYDELKLEEDKLIIKTHFDILDWESSSLPKRKAIVISVIPVNQEKAN